MTSAVDTSDSMIAAATARAESRVIAGRACGSCTLCCKVIAVTDFDKLPGVWCHHCVRGKGYGIYETRPRDCRTFFCEWMLEKGLGPEWKPERAKFALVMGESGHLTAFVDPGFPASWRGAPYYSAFKKLAAERVITIRTGTKVIVMLPDREIDLDHVGPDESVRLEAGPDGRIAALKVPRAQA